MEVENIQHYDYEQFTELAPLHGDMQNAEIESELPEPVKKDSRTFLWAGLISLMAGGALFAATNFGLGLLEFAGIALATGIGALAVGVFRGIGKIFAKKNLNLPKLKIHRKTKRRAKPQVRTIEPVQSKGGLRRSKTDSVLMGVCGGLARQSGISSSLIRLLFLAAFAITGGSAALIYFMLGAFLPQEK